MVLIPSMVIVCLPAGLLAPQRSYVCNLNVLHSAFLKVSVILINNQIISNRFIEKERPAWVIERALEMLLYPL